VYVVFRDGLRVALIDSGLAHPTTRLDDIVNALWYWAPLRDPRDRAPAFADADIPYRAHGLACGVAAAQELADIRSERRN
jgi:aminoglycoside phosphotransferase (APT) family kinase protein